MKAVFVAKCRSTADFATSSAWALWRPGRGLASNDCEPPGCRSFFLSSLARGDQRDQCLADHNPARTTSYGLRMARFRRRDGCGKFLRHGSNGLATQEGGEFGFAFARIRQACASLAMDSFQTPNSPHPTASCQMYRKSSAHFSMAAVRLASSPTP